MKKIIFLFCFILLSSGAFAQVLFTENFDYPAGDSIGAHGWIWNTGVTNTILVSSPGLTFPGYVQSGIGNAVTLKSNGNDAYKLLNDSVNTGSVYCAFMVRLDTVRTGDYFVALLQTGSTSFYEGRVQIRLNSGNIQFGITKANTTSDLTVPGIWSTTSYALNTTYVVVLKYTFVPEGTNNDQVSLFVFDSAVPPVEPVTPTIGPITYTSLDATSIGRVALRQGGAASASDVAVDGMRVMTSWFPATAVTGSVKLAVQGLFDSVTVSHKRRDTAVVYLHNNVSPYNIVDSSTAVIDSVSLTGNFTFPNASSGTYYIEVRYRKDPAFRNGINTWSKAGGEVIVAGVPFLYDFTLAETQAFGNNLKKMGAFYTIYNGDAAQNGVVQLADIVKVSNEAVAFSSGYRSTDLNYDNITNLVDIILTFNNSSSFVHQIIPAP